MHFHSLKRNFTHQTHAYQSDPKKKAFTYCLRSPKQIHVNIAQNFDVVENSFCITEHLKLCLKRKGMRHTVCFVHLKSTELWQLLQLLTFIHSFSLQATFWVILPPITRNLLAKCYGLEVLWLRTLKFVTKTCLLCIKTNWDYEQSPILLGIIFERKRSGSPQAPHVSTRQANFALACVFFFARL